MIWGYPHFRKPSYPCWTCWTCWTWSPASVHAAGLALLSAHASAPDRNGIVAQSIRKMQLESGKSDSCPMQLSYNRPNLVMTMACPFHFGFT